MEIQAAVSGEDVSAALKPFVRGGFSRVGSSQPIRPARSRRQHFGLAPTKRRQRLGVVPVAGEGSRPGRLCWSRHLFDGKSIKARKHTMGSRGAMLMRWTCCLFDATIAVTAIIIVAIVMIVVVVVVAADFAGATAILG